MKRPDYIDITRALVRYRMGDSPNLPYANNMLDSNTTKADREFTLQLLRLYAEVTQRKPIEKATKTLEEHLGE